MVFNTAELKQKDGVVETSKPVHNKRCHTSVARSFIFAHDVDEIKAAARYENGVLKLMLQKKANGSAKRLTVN